MTTIAYKDGVIAYDSRVTRGSLIDHDDYEKLTHRNGHQLLFTGCGADFAALMDEFFGVKDSDKPLDENGLVVTNARLVATPRAGFGCTRCGWSFHLLSVAGGNTRCDGYGGNC